MGKPGGGHAPPRRPEYIGPFEQTPGSEPSQYREEKKATAIPSVAASESGTAQTRGPPGPRGLWGRVRIRSGELPIAHLGEGVWKVQPKRVKAPYPKGVATPDLVPEYHGARETPWESGRTISQG